MDNITLWQFPFLGEVGQALRIDFYFARWGREWVLLRVIPKGFIGYKVAVWIAAFHNAFFFDCFKIRQGRIVLSCQLVEVLQPTLLIATFGEFFLNT